MAKMKKAKAPQSEVSAHAAPTEHNDEKAIAIKSGLLAILLPSLLGSTLVVAIIGALLFVLVLQPAAHQQTDLLSKAYAQHYLDDINQLQQTYQNAVESIANSELARNAVLAGPDALIDAEKTIQDLVPSATLVKLFRTGKSKKDSTTVPPISFAQLDMINKAEKKDRALPEIHQHDKKSYLTIVKAIQHDDTTVGSLLISFDFSSLKKELPPLAPEMGYVEILQTFSSKATAFYSAGQAQHKQGEGFEITGELKHWSARFYPAANTNVIASYNGLFWTLIGTALTLVIILSSITYVLLNKALQTNATVLAAYFQSMIQHDKPKHSFSLGIFSSLAKTVQRLFEDYDAKNRSALMNAKSNQHKTKDDLPDFDPTYSSHNVLDIDIHEDDNQLLSASRSAHDDPLDISDSMDTLELDTVSSSSNHLEIQVNIDAEIFRAYDIRGIVGKNIDSDVAHALGAAIGSEAIDQGQSAIIIGRDGRHSSADLASAMAEGIQSTGVNVIDIGMVPTPVLYYATKTLTTQSGVMITGSHNPPDYNGFKVVIADETLAQDKIQNLKHRLDNRKLHQGHGSYDTAEVTSNYMERICNDVVLAKPMRIVVDCGNGVTGPLATQLLDALGCMVTPLFSDIDGDFPNHHPDPSNPENLQDLIRTVQTEGAELGIAFDGDGDRIGVVTPSGKIIWPDRLLMLYAKDLLSRNPGSDILYDVKCTRDVAELVSGLGGRAIMCATGHSLMKARMKETKAVVGGELSGHIFFNDRWYGFDDALYSAARLLEILSMEPIEADEVFTEFPEKFSTPELHINVSEDSKFKIMEKLLQQGNFDGGNLVKVDGVRVDFPDSWGLVRASNTTPVLVARFEGDTEEALENVKSVFRNQLLAVEPGLKLSF